jgi:hypothetical protein
MLFRSKKSKGDGYKAKVVQWALDSGGQVTEIEKYDEYTVRLKLPNGSQINHSSGSDFATAYKYAWLYLKRYTWKDKVERVV